MSNVISILPLVLCPVRGSNSQKEECVLVKFYSTIYEKGLRECNQDSIAIQKIHTQKGEMLMAVVCDGMGGMDCGEIASGFVVQELSRWFYLDCAKSFARNGSKRNMEHLLIKKVFTLHEQLLEYGLKKRIHCGTTITVFLSFNEKYLVLSIGDSPAFLIRRTIKQLTNKTARSHVLQGCVGIGRFMQPKIMHGRIREETAFLLLSDGMYHYFSKDDYLHILAPKEVTTVKDVQRRLNSIVQRSIQRGETDNMSAIYLRY